MCCHGVGRSIRTYGAPSSRGHSSDGRSCQIVELEGQRKSSVLSSVVASHPEQSSVETIQVVQECADEFAAKKFHRLPIPLGVVCEASGVERRSGNWRPSDCCGGHSASGCRSCEDANDVRCNLMKNGKRESSVWNAGVSSGRSRPPWASVPPSRDQF